MRRSYLIQLNQEEFQEYIGATIRTALHSELSELRLIQPEEKNEELLDVASVARMLSRSRSRIYAYCRKTENSEPILIGHKLKNRRGLYFKKSQVLGAIQSLGDLHANIKTKSSNF